MMKLSRVQRLLLLDRHKGLLQRVAKRCRVHPSLVSRVFHGKASSARVASALEAELRRTAAGVGGERTKTASWEEVFAEKLKMGPTPLGLDLSKISRDGLLF